MARVSATWYRVVSHYRDAAGHRLPSKKGDWERYWYDYEADCPKCPEPEPVECDMAEYHEAGKVGKWYRFCPQCGKRLREV